MADILIRGVDLPKSNLDASTIVIFYDGFWANYDNPDNRGNIIELPPHGRLIDADAIDYKLSKTGYRSGEWVISADEIEKMPTVIPADKESET